MSSVTSNGHSLGTYVGTRQTDRQTEFGNMIQHNMLSEISFAKIRVSLGIPDSGAYCCVVSTCTCYHQFLALVIFAVLLFAKIQFSIEMAQEVSVSSVHNFGVC